MPELQGCKALKYIPRNKGRVLFHLCRFFPHSVGLWLQNLSRLCVKIPKLWTLDTCHFSKASATQLQFVKSKFQHVQTHFKYL